MSFGYQNFVLVLYISENKRLLYVRKPRISVLRLSSTRISTLKFCEHKALNHLGYATMKVNIKMHYYCFALAALCFLLSRDVVATKDEQLLLGAGVFFETIPHEERELSHTCPRPPCQNPCFEGRCGEGENCVTRSTTLSNGCPGCPVARCVKQVTCPALSCPKPCRGRCGRDETCVTRPTKLANGCPGCHKFVRCQKRQRCGKTLCHGSQVCCNASCGICTPPGGACIQLACVDGALP